MIMIMSFGMTAFAAEATTDPAVQASLDAYGKIKTAMENKDLEALRAATAEFENNNNKLSEEQEEELTVIIGEELIDVLFTAGAVEGMADAKEAFLADKNVETAMYYVDNYEMLVINAEWGTDTAALITDMIPDGQAVYEEALGFVPGENVLKVYDAYEALRNAVDFQWYDADFLAAMEGFEAVLDIYNELTDEEMAQLAALIGEESAEDAYSAILSDWITANVVRAMGELYEEYVNNPSEETAQAFIEYYDSIYNDPAYVDEDLRAAVEGFFWDIHDVYEEAKAFAGDDEASDDEVYDDETTGTDGDITVEDEKDASPKTGDEASVILPLTCMLAAAAVVVAAKRRRA